MNNILNYSLFLKESKNQNDVDQDQTGPEYKIYQMSHDEGGAAKRLFGRLVGGIKAIGKGISNFFGDKDAEKMDLDGLEKNKKQILDKWGEGIKVSGKNTKKDGEEFYRQYDLRGREYFGRDFDLKNPRNREERIYSGYGRDASKYFDDGI